MEMGISHQIEKPTKIELKYQKEKVYSFNLTDERHFGYMIMSTLWEETDEDYLELVKEWTDPYPNMKLLNMMVFM